MLPRSVSDSREETYETGKVYHRFDSVCRRHGTAGAVQSGRIPQALPNTYKLVISNPAKVDFQELDQIARRHDLLFCGVTNRNTGLQKSTVTFYTDADRQDAWQAYLGLKPGIMQDVLGNECTVSRNTLEVLMQNQEERNSVYYGYLVGDPADCDAAAEELYIQYGSMIQTAKADIVSPAVATNQPD